MFDTERFISEVEKHPALYNVKLKEYSNRDIKKKLWDEVAVIMYENWDSFPVDQKNKLGKELQTKWKSLRDQFRKELNLLKHTKSGESAKKKKKYIYFDLLLFLTPYSESRDTVCNLDNSINAEDHNNEEEAESPKTPRPSSSMTAVSNSVKKATGKTKQSAEGKEFREITKILSESIALQKEEKEGDKTGNKSFLMSLLPLLNKLPEDTIMETRLRIMQVVQQSISQNRRQFFAHPSTSSSPISQPPTPIIYEPPASPSTQFHTFTQTSQNSEYSVYDLYDQ